MTEDPMREKKKWTPESIRQWLTSPASDDLVEAIEIVKQLWAKTYFPFDGMNNKAGGNTHEI